jgi:hypothetical protein
MPEIKTDDHLTQPWYVLINGIEVYRDHTCARCEGYISRHTKDGTLPNPQPATKKVAAVATMSFQLLSAIAAVVASVSGSAIAVEPALLSPEGVPDIPWCKVGQTPKKDKCRNGSKSGGLYITYNGTTYLVAAKEEPDSRGSNRGNDKREAGK